MKNANIENESLFLYFLVMFRHSGAFDYQRRVWRVKRLMVSWEEIDFEFLRAPERPIYVFKLIVIFELNA